MHQFDTGLCVSCQLKAGQPATCMHSVVACSARGRVSAQCGRLERQSVLCELARKTSQKTTKCVCTHLAQGLIMPTLGVRQHKGNKGRYCTISHNFSLMFCLYMNPPNQKPSSIVSPVLEIRHSVLLDCTRPYLLNRTSLITPHRGDYLTGFLRRR